MSDWRQKYRDEKDRAAVRQSRTLVACHRCQAGYPIRDMVRVWGELVCPECMAGRP